MPADMAEDSTVLLTTLAENQETLEKQIGCLARLLQIFDRHSCLTSCRYGSNRTSSRTSSIATFEDAALTAYGTDVLHEPDSPSTYQKVQFDGQQLSSRVSIYEENRGTASLENRVSFKKEEATASSRLSSDFVNQTSQNSEDEKPRRETPEHATVLELNNPVTPVIPSAQCRMSTDGRLSFENFPRSPDSSLIRNIVINSLHKEKPRASVDNSNREVMAGLIRLKNLARSRSLGGRNGYSRTGVEFPRSNSLSAQRSSGVYKYGDEAMCIDSDAPKCFAREKVASNLTHLRRSVNGSETLRLTVELEEGPGVGIKKLQRNNSHNYYERDATREAVMNLDKSLTTVDLKESFRNFQREKSTRRSLVDGEQTSPAEVCVTPVPCVDGKRSPPRELPNPREEQEGRRGGSNVVARLMGLEEFTSPPTLRKDCKDDGAKDTNGHDQQRRGRSLSPKHRLMDGMPSPTRHQEALEALKSRLTKSMKHFYEEGPLLNPNTPSPTREPLHGDIIQRLQQLRSRNSVEEREILNQILETLQLKGLLHSPQHKSSATPQYVRQRFATAKDTPELSCREPITGHSMKHLATIMVMNSAQKDADYISSRSECSERSEATTSTRFSNEDGGSTKSGRGKSRSPVRSSAKASLRVNDDSRSTARASAYSTAVATNKLRSNSSISTSNNIARSPQVKQLLQGQPNSHLRDKKESKAALLTVRSTQSHGVSLKNDSVSDVKPNGTTKNSELHTIKSSVEVIRQKRPSIITSRDSTSLALRRSSPGRDSEDLSLTTSQGIVDKKKPTIRDSHAATDTSTDHDDLPYVDRETFNTTPARIREKLQTLRDQQMPVKNFSEDKESSEAMTPRAGLLVRKISQDLEKCQQGSEGCELRSPVSVLDNSVFEEDGSPSPMVAVNLQDSYESGELDLQRDEVSLENARELATTSLQSVDIQSDKNATSASNGDKERDFVDELLKLSGVTKHATWASETLISRLKYSDVNSRVLVDLNGNLQKASFESSADVVFHKCLQKERGKEMNTLDRQALIDFVYEQLATKVAAYENAQPWLESTWIGGQKLKRQHLVNTIWKELQEVPCAASDDICDTVQGILREDLGSRGPKWTDFRAEIGEVGVEVEKLIYRDLMEEMVKELRCSSASRSLAKLLEASSGPRRQLFAL